MRRERGRSGCSESRGGGSWSALVSGALGACLACSSEPSTFSVVHAAERTTAPDAGPPLLEQNDGAGIPYFYTDDLLCGARTCTELGWACGSMIDACGNVVDCAAEGLGCAPDQICTGGIDGPTVCTAGASRCDVCDAIPDCSSAAQLTRLTGRVVSPGRTDDDTANQLGIPNARVFILRSADPADLPAIATGLPPGGSSCQRCADEDVGAVLTGAVTDASGQYALEAQIPVGKEFLLVVEVGKFRRAVALTLPGSAACQTTAIASTLPDNPTRLPRGQSDGLGVNLPRVAITTGQIDAMECVFEKLGIEHGEFGNPTASTSASPHLQLYRGGPDRGNPPGAGARIDADTPHDSALYGDPTRLEQYDLVVADCEGATWDSSFAERDASGGNVREYVNRGGRLFASHLSFSWLNENGRAPYSASDPVVTGLGPAATWSANVDTSNAGTGEVSIGRPNASPHIDSFAAWMVNEGITTAGDATFPIVQPRSQTLALGSASEEFVFRDDGNERVQQFSFNTPYAAPAEAECGRVSYSGFHVSAGEGATPYADAVFPEHCSGDLTDQEKVLAYMLFDLSACIGDQPVPPRCVPVQCGQSCDKTPDGCGNVLDCGPCGPPP